MKTNEQTQSATAKPLAPATCYAEWRVRADEVLAELDMKYWHHWKETRRIEEMRSDLMHVMANGASGGTAWTLHNS